MARNLMLLLCVAGCLLTAQGAARPARRDAPPAPSVLEELQRNAQEFQKTFSEQLGTLVNSKNTEQLKSALRDGSDSVLQQLSTLSGSLQSALSDANGRAKEALEQTRANLERTAAELRRAHPDVEQQAGALRDKLQQAVASTVAETQKLAQEVTVNAEHANERLAPKIKEAFDSFLKQTGELQKKLHDAANKQ